MFTFFCPHHSYQKVTFIILVSSIWAPVTTTLTISSVILANHGLLTSNVLWKLHRLSVPSEVLQLSKRKFAGSGPLTCIKDKSWCLWVWFPEKTINNHPPLRRWMSNRLCAVTRFFLSEVLHVLLYHLLDISESSCIDSFAAWVSLHSLWPLGPVGVV